MKLFKEFIAEGFTGQTIGNKIIGRVQPKAGKAAVDPDGLELRDSVVLNGDLIAVKRGPEILLVDVNSTKILGTLDSNAVKSLRKLS